MFSSRLPDDLSPNSMALARERLGSFIDLTDSNPTRVGFAYPPDLLAPLNSQQALTYEPAPLGLLSARQAVAADYERRGEAIAAGDIVMTASTSEAYSLLFKLLCNPGDLVLAPRPSYPLFDHLTTLDGVTLAHYQLEYEGSWRIDLAGLARAITPRTRAVLLVHPNNPTGSTVSDEELAHVADLCRRHDMALISDEVFSDYPLGARHQTVRSALGRSEALTFSLGGLSKTIGLPQLKAGWIGLGGARGLVETAKRRMEVICDAYLSVSTPVQIGLLELLRRGSIVREQIRVRIRTNYEALEAALRHHPACTLLPVEAGWYAVIQVPSTVGEEALVLELLERCGVLVHPGYFFDFPRESFLVVSLLPRTHDFQQAISRLLSHVTRSMEH